MAANEKPNALLEDKSLEENSGEEEEDEVRDEHQKPLIDCDSSTTDNVIPLSIGKIKIFKPRRRNRFLLKKYFKTCSLISVVIFIIFYLYRLKDSLYLSEFSFIPNKAHCDRLSSDLVWNTTFPMLTIESALRLVDVDNDTVLDVIVPFGTGKRFVWENYSLSPSPNLSPLPSLCLSPFLYTFSNLLSIENILPATRELFSLNIEP